MNKAVIRNGRWVRENGEPLDPVEKNQMQSQVSRIHEFAKDVTDLTHDKIEILSHILYATPHQERAILKILSMKEDDINSLL